MNVNKPPTKFCETKEHQTHKHFPTTIGSDVGCVVGVFNTFENAIHITSQSVFKSLKTDRERERETGKKMRKTTSTRKCNDKYGKHTTNDPLLRIHRNVFAIIYRFFCSSQTKTYKR